LSGWWTTEVALRRPKKGEIIEFTFGGNFNPRMRITGIDEPSSVEWECVGGHEPWAENTFRFEFEDRGGEDSVLRFWQHYARELDDDAYGIYNYNWGYYLQSLYELVTTGKGKPFDPTRPERAVG
jgi:hypothetical protein